MFRMLSCFDVKPGVSETDYNALMQDLAKHLTELDPIEGIGVLENAKPILFSMPTKKDTNSIF